MIRVVLPAHLRTLARVDGEVELDVAGQVTQCSVLDALEARYPALAGTIRDHDGSPRRAFIRFPLQCPSGPSVTAADRQRSLHLVHCSHLADHKAVPMTINL
jgi:molybdopterin converting factor small subunit